MVVVRRVLLIQLHAADVPSPQTSQEIARYVQHLDAIGCLSQGIARAAPDSSLSGMFKHKLRAFRPNPNPNTDPNPNPARHVQTPA